jgi:hypothetical protein
VKQIYKSKELIVLGALPMIVASIEVGRKKPNIEKHRLRRLGQVHKQQLFIHFQELFLPPYLFHAIYNLGDTQNADLFQPKPGTLQLWLLWFAGLIDSQQLDDTHDRICGYWECGARKSRRNILLKDLGR